MSLPSFSTQASLFSLAALSGTLFPETDPYRIFSRTVYPRLVAARAQLEQCYAKELGRVAIEPVVLLGVCCLQFVEGVPDRAAVELLRYHAGWCLALNLQLGECQFHPTTLVNFRQRLLTHQLSAVAFQAVLDGLVDAGLVSRAGRQRLDSTQILGQVSRMSRLECVRETLRLALKEVEPLTPVGTRPEWWAPVWERYVESKLDYRTQTNVLQEKMVQAGIDATRLLEWARAAQDPGLAGGEQVQLLARVWQENYEVVAAEQRQREAQPPGAVHNPHDPEAQWAAKGQGKHRKEHVGYKVQVAETVSQEPLAEGEPTRNFVTAMATQPAIASDDAGLPLVEQEQAGMGLGQPSHWYVDSAYVSAERLAQAQAEGRELIGPAQGAPKKEGRFSVEEFKINVEAR